MAKEKPWMDKGWLYDRYVVKKMGIEKIAEECKNMGISVTPMTIWNALDRFELIKNRRNLGKRSYGKPGTGNKGKGYYG